MNTHLKKSSQQQQQQQAPTWHECPPLATSPPPPPESFHRHSKLCIITPVATKVHVTLWSFVVSTWMHNTIELV